MDDAAIEEMTFHYFPERVVRDLTRSVFTARHAAWDRCKAEFARPEEENLRPYESRARLEQLMRGVADRHEAISAVVEKQPGQPWNHTELSNGPVVMTAATVQTPLEMVDPAEYRLALASSPQTQIETLADPAPENGRLYILLLHSRSHWVNPAEERDYGFLPGSVYLAYPNAELKNYRYWINLFDRFPDVVKAMTPEEWDDQALNLYIQRSRRIYNSQRRNG